MTNEEKIVKGRHHLMMKVRQKYGEDTTNDDLMKIPLVGLHSIALQQISEQEAYIEELEEKIKSLEKELSKKEAKFALTRQENREIAQEVRREQVIEMIYTESREFKGENKRLREDIKTLIGKLCLKDAEIEALKAQITSIS